MMRLGSLSIILTMTLSLLTSDIGAQSHAYSYQPDNQRMANARMQYQQTMRPQSYQQPPSNYRLSDYPVAHHQMHSRGHRVANSYPPQPKPQFQDQTPAEYYPEQNLRVETAPRTAPMENIWVERDSNWVDQNQNWSDQSDYAAGQYPFLTGDEIFGVSRFECCDEWAGLCDCLALTNRRSNCECTNPNRTKKSCGSCGSQSIGSTCQGYDRSASRGSVSEYFHPRKYR